MERPQVDTDTPNDSVPVVGRVWFFRGTVKHETGPPLPCCWAETDFGIVVLRDPESCAVEEIQTESVSSGELLTTVDLEDLDRQNTEFIVGNLLAGNYLDRPGLCEREDSLLFVLVNEALHRLRHVEAAENDLLAPVDPETPAVAE